MNVSILRRSTIAISILALLAAYLVMPVSAQDDQKAANGFKISPVRSEYIIEKGQSQVMTITLENPADIATNAIMVINDFVASTEEDGEPRLILDDNAAETPKNSFKQLVQPGATVQLGPNEKKEINVTIRVPENANSGGYYGAIRFSPSSQELSGGNVGLTASVGTIVLITVPGNLTERLDLLELSAAQSGKARGFFTSGKVDLLTRLKNEGDIHVKPFGKLVVRNMFGKVVYETEFNYDGKTDASRSSILPGSIRKFENSIGDTKLLGRYTIEANIAYTQGSGEFISTKTSFWYMPAWALAAVAAIVLAIVGAGYMLYRKYSMAGPKHGAKK